MSDQKKCYDSDNVMKTIIHKSDEDSGSVQQEISDIRSIPDETQRRTKESGMREADISEAIDSVRRKKSS
ncbi:MAG TPA: hypothetical protein DHW39_05505 [Erysipelotrichaceae bacterium]|nr:hypothetical protein [Erysipelotrichaceae bacterium]